MASNQALGSAWGVQNPQDPAILKPINSALLSQLTLPKRACFHPAMVRMSDVFQGVLWSLRQGASHRMPNCQLLPSTQDSKTLSLRQDSLATRPAKEPAAFVCLPGCFPSHCFQSRQFVSICTRSRDIQSPSASFLICRPSFAVQLCASAVWVGACRSYLAGQLGVIQPETPKFQTPCHVLTPVATQFSPHSEKLTISQNPNPTKSQMIPRCHGCNNCSTSTDTEKNQSSDARIPSCTHLSASHAHICDPRRSLCTDISAAHGGTSSDHHKEHIASASGHGNLESK